MASGVEIGSTKENQTLIGFYQSEASACAVWLKFYNLAFAVNSMSPVSATTSDFDRLALRTVTDSTLVQIVKCVVGDVPCAVGCFVYVCCFHSLVC